MIFSLAYIITIKPLYTDIRYNDKIRYNDNLNGTIPLLKIGQIIRDIQENCI